MIDPGSTVIQRLSVVVPAYNEAHRIESSVDAILAWGERLEVLELIVVDDGSSDGTADLIRSRYGERVRLLSHAPRNGRGHGKGAAVRTGVAAAAQPWLLFVDADLPVEIATVERFAEQLDRAEIVIASKRMPGSFDSLEKRRKLGGRLGNLLISACVVSGFRDTQCGFKLFRSDVAKELFAVQRIDGFGFDFEVLYLAKQRGYRVLELPAEIVNKAYGTVSLSSYWQVLREVAAFQVHRLRGHYRRGAGQVLAPAAAKAPVR
jgi:glycosyltransferase involved in cell wall biosynthesis